VLFLVLTVAVAFAAPSPLALGAHAVGHLEQQLGAMRAGKKSVGHLTPVKSGDALSGFGSTWFQRVKACHEAAAWPPSPQAASAT